jgi:hypothetical protein
MLNPPHPYPRLIAPPLAVTHIRTSHPEASARSSLGHLGRFVLPEQAGPGQQAPGSDRRQVVEVSSLSVSVILAWCMIREWPDRADQCSRLWFLSTVMALYKMHLQTLPRLRDLAYPISDLSSSSTSTLYAKARTDLVDAEWTNRKLLADLIFSCKSLGSFHIVL